MYSSSIVAVGSRLPYAVGSIVMRRVEQRRAFCFRYGRLGPAVARACEAKLSLDERRERSSVLLRCYV